MKLRERLSFANIVAVLALVIALAGTGGVAYAHGLIGSSDIKKGAVKSKHISKGAVKSGKIAKGAVGPDQLSQRALGARAFVHVTRVGGDFVVDSSRMKDVVDVVLPGTGNTDRPCLVLPAWIDASTAVAIGTVDAQNTPDAHTASVQHRVGGEGSQGCTGNSIALFLKRNGTGSADTIAFNVMVP